MKRQRHQRTLTAEQQALAAKWTRFAWKYAQQYARLGFEADELAAAANVGLCEAAIRFDPENGARFSTYAKHWILAMIRAYCAENWSPFGKRSRSMQRIHALVSEISEAEQEHGEGALVVVAEKHHRDPQTVALVLNRGSSIDAVPAGGEDWTLRVPQLIDATTPEDILISSQERRSRNIHVRAAMSYLDRREAAIIEQRIMCDEKVSLEALGDVFGVSKERVRQLEARALGKLRARLA